MEEKIKKQLEQLLVFKNDHSINYDFLYSIAMETIDKKIGQVAFKDIVGEDLYERYYNLYDNLVDFAQYLRKNGKYNG